MSMKVVGKDGKPIQKKAQPEYKLVEPHELFALMENYGIDEFNTGIQRNFDHQGRVVATIVNTVAKRNSVDLEKKVSKKDEPVRGKSLEDAFVGKEQ